MSTNKEAPRRRCMVALDCARAVVFEEAFAVVDGATGRSEKTGRAYVLRACEEHRHFIDQGERKMTEELADALDAREIAPGHIIEEAP